MNIKTITYKRIKNLGNYQSETLEATAELGENDSPEMELENLRRFVMEGLLTPTELAALNPKQDEETF